ncbi:MAG TPA: ABC transporter substrate-binding protein [Acidimicrobiales bacterium]|nr:ABC transporter substrate-binding protein [Acidimicrobiales bacterium]
MFAPRSVGARPAKVRRSAVGALLVVGTVLLGTVVGMGAGGAAKSKGPSLAGVSITFGDQVDEYQTIVNATNTLAGAPYKVVWSNFIGGPPIVAAEVGGSVDLGDMAETPVIFAQAAGDPVKVIAITQGVGTTSPYGILVPTGSSITTAADLRGKTIAVQEGTVEQYVLVKVLQAAHIPYTAVTIDNLNVVAGEAALEAGQVDAWVGTQPFIATVTQAGKGHVIPTAASSAKVLGYLTAPVSALNDPSKAAAITNFIVRLYKSEAILRKDPELAIKTYVSTYGVSEAVAAAAVKSAKVIATPITPAVIKYQQAEANTFQSLGLIPNKLDVASVFDLSLNKKIAALAGLS